MSTSRDSCCLLSVKKQKHDFQVFVFVQCIIKQLLDSVFVTSRIIKVSVRVISLSLRLWLLLRLIPPTSTLIILDITKTSSNNCLLALKSLIGGVVNYLDIFNHKTEKIHHCDWLRANNFIIIFKFALQCKLYKHNCNFHIINELLTLYESGNGKAKQPNEPMYGLWHWKVMGHL